MQHLGLFEGIGGFSLAARWIGWETVAWCEINPFCQQVLKHHFPNAEPLTDIKLTNFTKYAGAIDIITGGFPCQPYSLAGKRKGKEDERHLWPEMLRAIREVKPRWVVGENVSGLISWDGGLVFDEVQTDLEAEGYEVQPFILPACAVNAPHRRDRVWFVANARGLQPERGGGFGELEGSTRNGQGKENKRERLRDAVGCVCEVEYVADTADIRRERNREPRNGRNGFENENINVDAINPNDKRCREQSRNPQPDCPGQSGWQPSTDWSNWPTQPPVCSGNDGISSGLDGITFPKWRNESIKGYGNAVVPQVAFQIFKAIQAYETL